MENRYQRANVFLATLLFVFCPGKYQKIAAKHDIAITLEAPDLALSYQQGKFSPNELEYLSNALERSLKLKAYLVKSFFIVLCTLLLAVIIGFFSNKVSLSLPVSLDKIINIVSVFLLTWAALFELGWSLRTWKGEVMHELVHSLLFKIILVSGSFSLMIALII